MIKLLKPFIVIYDEQNVIIVSMSNNTETIVGEGRKYAEFDSEEEMINFISDNHLQEI